VQVGFKLLCLPISSHSGPGASNPLVGVAAMVEGRSLARVSPMGSAGLKNSSHTRCMNVGSPPRLQYKNVH